MSEESSSKIITRCRKTDVECVMCRKYRECIRKKRERERKIIIKKALKAAFIAGLVACFVLLILAAFGTNSEAKEESKPDEKNKEPTEFDGEVETIGNESETQEETAEEEEKETKPDLTKISANAPGREYVYVITEEEKLVLAKMVYLEARGECFKGKVAVVAVAFNRLYSEDPRFDTESITSIITQPGQFCDISTVTLEMLAEVPECETAVEAACKGWDPTRVMFADGAKFFYAPRYISDSEMAKREGVPTLEIENHSFHNDFNT